MIVEQIWTANSFRNFHYLIACPETGEALAIDPLDHQRCLDRAQERGFTITQILNTHEHGDHTGGNGPLVAATGARLLAHAKAAIPNVDRGLDAKDVIKVGKTVELEALDTPGHTMSHICLLSHTDTPALFSGDTMFNAGAGHCKGGGHPQSLYQTFLGQLHPLPDQTQLYPGHDYIANNLRFTLDREPDNERARSLLAQVENQGHQPAPGLHARSGAPDQHLLPPAEPQRHRPPARKIPDLPEHPDTETVFLKLRELRNSW
jgi:hydroxyacylglutathione hydrolase